MGSSYARPRTIVGVDRLERPESGMRAPRAAHLSNVTTVRATSLPKTKFTVVSGYPRGEKQENFRRKLAYFLPVHRRKVVKPSDALSRSASGAIAASTAARRGLICPDDVVFAITSPDNARQDETRRITYTLVAGVRRGARSCAREREVENARSRISLVSDRSNYERSGGQTFPFASLYV